ncbi:MAG: ABC transporter ATP-binding protein [Candidatus Omnitrophica bacterium]|nr:ABC transporter ATP-binding protein [Candidatus Omnitrophota bacterium]
MAIKLENITKVFKTNNKELRVLENINLDIKDQEALVIFGQSGAGKTTLMNIIGAIDKPTSGKITIDGIDISGLESDGLADLRKQKIGFIFQSFNLLPNLKAKDNIILPVLLDRDNAKKIERVLEFAEKIGLKERLEHLPQELSSGEQQRVAIMRAMVNFPSIILADEPTANLDDTNAKKIIDILKDLNQKYGCTVLIATNDEQTASNFLNRFTLK